MEIFREFVVLTLESESEHCTLQCTLLFDWALMVHPVLKLTNLDENVTDKDTLHLFDSPYI